MKRRILPFAGLALLAVLGPAPAAIGSSSAAVKTTKVTVTAVKLLPSGCGTEVNCIEVTWNVANPPANQQTMSFEVSGRLTTQSGSCTSSTVPANSSARSAKVGFFQGGSCTGQVTSADMTVKLFTRDIEGQKVLTSTANRSQAI